MPVYAFGDMITAFYISGTSFDAVRYRGMVVLSEAPDDPLKL